MRNFNNKMISKTTPKLLPCGQTKINPQHHTQEQDKVFNDAKEHSTSQSVSLSLQQRGLMMFQEGQLTDCEFQLNEDDSFDESEYTNIRAHKVILVYASDVFRSMFLGQFPNEDVVVIKDVKPKIFKHLLRFSYTSDIAEEEISFEELLELAVSANKYLMLNLQKICIDLARKKLTPIKVFAAEYVAELLDEKKLLEDCLRVIKTSAASALLSKCFLGITKPRLLTLLDSEKLNISSEMTLINACMRWAQCNHPDGVNAVMRSFLPKLRLLSLTSHEFSANIETFSWLTDSEKVAVFVNITSKRDAKIEIPSEFCKEENKREAY
ncbi:kelch-like ECH-associated protein 1B [Neocloeon triangulifer]|uniref:kelch-like ECH-associated protein 1B n=1 Tax=Neocloeon triangulifer TaxID=2078957 RepID=UPI00286F3164|nr:kelch-like ECH-associated protein 1B [Neocloeon triangulifer]